LIYHAFGRRDVDRPHKCWTEDGLGLNPTLVRREEKKSKWELAEQHIVKGGKEKREF
jgi:hypothetical protein